MAMLGTHTLIHPIVRETRDNSKLDQVNEEELKPAGFCVTVRRPKAKHMRAFDKHGGAAIAAMIEMLGKVSNLSPDEVEELDHDDFEALGNLLGVGEPSGLKTGETA